MEYDVKAVGTRIARLRHQSDMTQEELAEKIGITVKHLSRVERGNYSLSPQNLLNACEALSTCIDYIYTGRYDVAINSNAQKIIEKGSESEKQVVTDFLASFAQLIENK